MFQRLDSESPHAGESPPRPTFAQWIAVVAATTAMLIGSPRPVQADGQTVTLVAAHSGDCLDVRGGGHANRTRVQQYPCNGTDAQRWVLRPVDTGGLISDAWGEFTIVNVGSGRCLDVPGNTGQWGVQLQIYDCNGTTAQVWTLPNWGANMAGGVANVLDGGSSAIVSGNGLCMDVSGASMAVGAPVIQWQCNNQRNQTWTPW